jgi:hypothetical protein
MGRLIEKYWGGEPECIRERYYIDEAGKRQGLYQYWYDNGQLWERCEYVNGKQQGTYQRWHDNGQLWIQCEYVNGKIHGLYQYWHTNGKPEYECEYVNGKRHGLFQRWYDNGELWEQGWYEKCIKLVKVNYYKDKDKDNVSIELRMDQSIESGAFLGNVISGLDEEGVEYVITYFD